MRPFALYDLSSDPEEEIDLIKTRAHSAKVDAIAAILSRAIVNAVGEAEMARRPKAIGYLEK